MKIHKEEKNNKNIKEFQPIMKRNSQDDKGEVNSLNDTLKSKERKGKENPEKVELVSEI